MRGVAGRPGREGRAGRAAQVSPPGSPSRLALACLVLASGCSGGSPSAAAPGSADSAAVARARTAADGLGRDLMGLLSAEMARGGPEAAIAVCADSAQRRTERHQAEGLRIRRVGTRVRNPANAPDTVEQAVLQVWDEAMAKGRPPGDTSFAAAAPDGPREVRYLRPIRVAEMCLACHGDPGRQSPRVRSLLAERYPMDRAVGYAVGDLRGAISVRVPTTR